MLLAILQTCDINGFSYHATNYHRWRHCVNNLSYTHLIKFMCNNKNSFKRILNYFSEFDDFRSSAKKPAGGVSSCLEQIMILQHQWNITT